MKLTNFFTLYFASILSFPTLAADAFKWLEDRQSKEALAWVDRQNEKAFRELKQNPLYSQIHAEYDAIFNASDRMPHISRRGDFIYDLYQGPQHKRGLWRRCAVEAYRQPEAPEWETVLDLDQLATDEKADWVWAGALSHEPDHSHAMISLSRGGQDAVEVREFDLVTKTFVKDGFYFREAKTRIAWLDANRLIVGTNFGAGSLTQSKYPRILKIVQRGQRLKDAQTIFEAEKQDLSVSAWVHKKDVFIFRTLDFYRSETYKLQANGTAKLTPLPTFAETQGIFKGQLIFKISKEWNINNQTFPSGALLSIKVSDLDTGELKPQAVYLPAADSSIEGIAITKDFVVLSLLTNVQGKLLKYTHKAQQGWQHNSLDLPDFGSISILTAEDTDNNIVIEYESFLTPTKQWELNLNTEKKALIDWLPSRFNEANFEVRQLFSTSPDGTQIPYFIVHKKGLVPSGKNPTLLYGYGGFMHSLTPSYLAGLGKVWLERGGVYVLANIRGGGEFGPNWHQAALLENRQRAFDDFISVGRDLVRRGITSAAHLGIMGGSNGGLLVGAVMTQAPELCNAVICQVPLLDMLRYHLFPAGASWMAEYGDPRDPKMKAWLRKMSPYHNVNTSWTYPKTFFITSTADDRVNPMHARKMAALLLSQGQEVLFYENRVGGHSAAADIDQRIERSALEMSFLFQQLSPQTCEMAAAPT